jgi:hypothetical protein
MHDEPTPDRDDLDVLLDAALSTYTDPGPSPHLSRRIISETTQRRRAEFLTGRMTWAVPALAALLLIAAVLIHHRPAPLQSPHVAEHSQPAAQASATGVSNAPMISPAVTTTSRLRSSQPRLTKMDGAVSPQPALPKREVFPTPTPLSHEEQALVALVNRDTHDSKELAQQITQPALQGQPLEPLRIAAIHIPPLNPPDNGNN